MNKIDKLASEGNWTEALKEFCKENNLEIEFSKTKDKGNKIEIYFENELMETLNGLFPEVDYHDISQTMLSKLLMD